MENRRSRHEFRSICSTEGRVGSRPGDEKRGVYTGRGKGCPGPRTEEVRGVNNGHPMFVEASGRTGLKA